MDCAAGGRRARARIVAIRGMRGGGVPGWICRLKGAARRAHSGHAQAVPGCGEDQRGSRPISRVLSWTIIHLGPPSPAASSDLPESAAGHGIAFLLGLAPGGVYLAAACCHLRGALLPHHFTLTRSLAVCFLLHFP